MLLLMLIIAFQFLLNKLLEISDVLRERLEEVGVKVLKNGYDTITVGTTTIDHDHRCLDDLGLSAD